MRTLVLLVVALVAVAALPPTIEEVQFRKWMTAHGRRYSDSAEYFHRLQVFKHTLTRIQNSNQQSSSATFGLGPFSDLTPEEFKNRLTYRAPASFDDIPPLSAASLENPAMPELVDAAVVDWRTHGAVSPVKDQGNCGSCWAFSTTEAIESQWFLFNGTLPTLSPQQIVDCDMFPTDQACNGGTTQFAYEYVMLAGGMDSENDYPYISGQTGDRGGCSFDGSALEAKIGNWTYAVPVCTDFICDHQDETLMASMLASRGPLSVCLNANNWQDYVSGVMDPNTCGGHGLLDEDHCVQVVGYNQQASPSYWIVRNSWNVQWGVAGYIYLTMGSNTCGVANMVTLPLPVAF